MKIVLATDGSDHSLKAAEQLPQLVPITPDTQITLLYVYPVPVEYGAFYAPAHPGEPRVIEASEPALQRTRAALQVSPEQVRSVTAMGSPAVEIVRYAEDVGADLLVLGSRGLGGLRELLLGSVSSAVVHRAHCPVMVVR